MHRLATTFIALALLLIAAPAAAIACPVRAGSVDVTKATIPQLRAALAAGEVTSRQLTETYLARIAALNDVGPRLHAVISTAPNALAQADAADLARAAGLPQGPLAGIPILLKDNIDTFDMATTAGAKAMLGPPPPTDATIAAKLRAAGAVILGKANMSEWATSISKRAGLSFSDVGGRLHNPYDGGETSGSSNGSAVAASSSLAAVTVGSETQGSIMLPSFINSAVGIKTTFGLVPRGGTIPLIPSFDVFGPIARSVTDAALLLDQLTGEDPRDPVTRAQRGQVTAGFGRFLKRGALRGARIGIPRALDPEPSTSIVGKRRIVRVLREAGATLVPMRETLFPGAPPINGILGEFKSGLNDYLAERGPTSPRHSLTEVVDFNRAGGKDAVRFGQEFLIKADKVGPKGQRRAFAEVGAYKARAHRMLERGMARYDLDAILSPRFIAAVTATSAGHPTITVPAGYEEQTPFGIVLIGHRFDEPKLIGYAYDFEQRTSAWRSPALINPDFAAVCRR